eukprot:Phypoly_transcript_00050.p1 GENE.Phypoly_transcript_00050~~Phypoly_transcript_00050.p1  ORF type:complete len:851 (+),score=68.86 Phypoly_transcript_00050:2980-5532(+)
MTKHRLWPQSFLDMMLVLFFLLLLEPHHCGTRSADDDGHEGPHEPTASSDFAVHLHPDFDPISVANELGVEYVQQIGKLKCHHLFRARDNDHATEVHSNLAEHASVKWFERQVLRKRSTRSVIPSEHDGNIARTDEGNTWAMPTDPLFEKQWHLFDNKVQGDNVLIGMNVVSAWPLATGLGVCVAIVDDGILYLHPDLKEKYSEANSYNFNGDNKNILPTAADPHGTMCAGAAAAATNDVCGVGVAYHANVSGLRILGGPSHDAMEAAALMYNYDDNHIFSNSWGPTDDGQTLEGPGPLTQAALEDGVQNGRRGLGSIYVWAVGNGAARGDNCNYDGYASSRYVLTVAAVDYLGHHPYFSELCAAIIISAPSTGTPGTNIITTNMNYDCDTKFSGTSAAAPLVAGVVALMLEANPLLTWRDVHHVMVNTARRNDISDPDWIENGAKHYVNHKYGFGIVDAHAAVVMSTTWTTVSEEISIDGPVVEVGQSIPDNQESGIISTVEIFDNIKLEHVEVVFSATHPIRTDLRVVLYSPSGTPSYLSEMHGTSSGYVLKVHLAANETIECKVVSTKFSISPTAWTEQFIDAPLVLVPSAVACEPSNSLLLLNSSIAVIPLDETAFCLWTTKAKLAQESGALAVVIVSKGRPYSIEGYDSAIVIPVVMIGSPESIYIISNLTTNMQNNNNLIGTLSTSVTMKNTAVNFHNWVFSTVHLWDEGSIGNWSLEVYDLHSAGEGEFNRWQLRLHGTNITDNSTLTFQDLSTLTSSNLTTAHTELTPTLNSEDSSSTNHSETSWHTITTTTSYFGSFFGFVSSIDRSMTLIIIVVITTVTGFGWYFIEHGRARQSPQDTIV